MEFMRDGGIVMWVVLFVGLAMLGAALARREKDGWLFAGAGAVICLAFGVIGYSLGTVAVMNALSMATPDQRWMLLQVGTQEAVNNNLLGGAFAVLLSIVSIVLYPRR